ncbi:MAG: glycerophosphodiester phosphodiesterase [Gemmatimonadota bacterium]|nr:glycerophosphodiester phosphodiesterase [Gemmatimonadota bacterium]
MGQVSAFAIIAHRGVTDHAPGNTLAAFRAAVALGIDGVELDVRLSRDGVPLVHHDWYVDETVPQPVPLYTLSAAEATALTVWDWRPELAGMHPIPTLDGVLHEFAGRISLEIELKSPEPELPSAVASALLPFRESWTTIELTSFSPSLLRAARDLCPGIRTALLLSATPAYMHDDALAYFAVHSARLAAADVIHLAPDQLSDDVVTTIRAAGVDIHVYVADSERTNDVVDRYRVPEIITDEPARLLSLRRLNARNR